MSYLTLPIAISIYLTWFAGSVTLLALVGILCAFLALPADEHAEQRVRTVGNLLPPLTIGICLIAVIFVPFGTPPPAIPIRGLHYAGVALLFGFLTFATMIQLHIWRQCKRADDFQCIVVAYRRWWVAAKLAPAPAALTILFSGLRMTFEHPGMDVSQVAWLGWLVAGFAYFFFDGLLLYLPEVCRMYRLAKRIALQDAPLESFQKVRDRRAESILVAHAISLPFILGLPILRPLDLPQPFHWLSAYFSGYSVESSQLLRALVLVLGVGFALMVVRLPGLIRRNRQH